MNRHTDCYESVAGMNQKKRSLPGIKKAPREKSTAKKHFKVKVWMSCTGANRSKLNPDTIQQNDDPTLGKKRSSQTRVGFFCYSAAKP